MLPAISAIARPVLCAVLPALALMMVPASVSAQDAGDTAAQSSKPAKSVDDSSGNTAISPYWSWKKALENDGLKFDFNYTSEDLIAVRGGDNGTLYHAGQLSFTAQADMDKLVGWNGAALFTSISKRDGKSINQGAGIGALLGPQEIFGRGNVVRASQFWLDQRIGDSVSLRVGRVNPGSDFQSFDCNFINLSYCGNQVGNIVSDYWFNYPISQWGAIAEVKTGRSTSFKAGAYQVRPQNLGNGLISTLDPKGGTGALVPVEFGWTPQLGSSGQASVKLGGWYSTADRNDVYLDAHRTPAAGSGAAFLRRDGSYGSYLSVVAAIPAARTGSKLTGFFNAALADSRTSTVDRTFALGVVFTGPLQGRVDDQIGLAVSYNHLNRRLSDYRREVRSLGGSALPPGTGENALELYYGLQLTRFLQFRPDVQWVRNPGGSARNPDAIIIGARTSLTF